MERALWIECRNEQCLHYLRVARLGQGHGGETPHRVFRIVERLEGSVLEGSVLEEGGGGPLHFVLGDGPQGDPADIHVGITHRLR